MCTRSISRLTLRRVGFSLHSLGNVKNPHSTGFYNSSTKLYHCTPPNNLAPPPSSRPSHPLFWVALTCRPDNDKHPERKEAALRMIGSVSHIITKKGSPILAMMESFLVSHVFPEFQSPHGYMRARACECLNRFSEIDFENHDVA